MSDLPSPPDTVTSSVTDAGPEGAAESGSAYWRSNVRLLLCLLAVWFFVSFGCGILFAPMLDRYMLPGTGFPLGFWFAQQGSIYAFVILIFVYVVLMNRMDRRFGVQED